MSRLRQLLACGGISLQGRPCPTYRPSPLLSWIEQQGEAGHPPVCLCGWEQDQHGMGDGHLQEAELAAARFYLGVRLARLALESAKQDIRPHLEQAAVLPLGLRGLLAAGEELEIMGEMLEVRVRVPFQPCPSKS